MNADLRNAITSMCEKLNSPAFTSAAEITIVINKLKKHTGGLHSVDDHQLFMNFYALVARHQEKSLLQGLSLINQESALTDKMQLLIKFCRELLVLLDVSNAQKAKNDFVFYANGIVSKLDIILNLISLVTWKTNKDKDFFMQSATAIYEKLQAEGWDCASGSALGLVPRDDVDFEKKYQLFLRALKSNAKINDKLYQKPFDTMGNIVYRLEKLQLADRHSLQERDLARYPLSQHGMFPRKRGSHYLPQPAKAPVLSYPSGSVQQLDGLNGKRWRR